MEGGLVDPAVIAALAVLLSALQVALLRVIDYYFPKGHTRTGDHIAETRAEREERHRQLYLDRKKTVEHEDDDYDIVDDSET